MEALQLTPQALDSIDIAKVFKDSSQIQSMDFSPDGFFLLTSSDTISLYNVLKAAHMHTFSYPSSLIRYTTHSNAFLSASCASLDYWSLTSSRIIHSFPASEICSIDASPIEDLCISSNRYCLTMHSFNTKRPVSMLELNDSIGNVICKFDHYGLIMVIAYSVIQEGRNKIILQVLDPRKTSKGAVSVWTYEGGEVISIDFSFDGQFLLVATKGNTVMIIDALDGKLKNMFKDYTGNGMSPSLFSPDSRYFCTACDKNFGVVVANVENCQKKAELRGNVKSINAMAWNPEHCVLATGNEYLLLWAPDYKRIR
jgi:WD40 repeat protein